LINVIQSWQEQLQNSIIAAEECLYIPQHTHSFTQDHSC
jgi:hypothetical protein